MGSAVVVNSGRNSTVMAVPWGVGEMCLSHLSDLPPKAEDRPDAVVVRLYEAHGSTGVVWLHTSLPVKEAML